MTDRLTRSTHLCDIEVRSSSRTIFGIAAPFDAETTIAERGRRYVEVFRRGAFARTIAEQGPQRIKLLVEHDRQKLPVGRATLLREDTAGLYAEFRVSATVAGDEVLELVRDGALDALSVGFREIPSRDRWDRARSRVERLEVALVEVSVVAWGAYDGARIEGVRTVGPRRLSSSAARRRLDLIQRNRT